MKRTAFISALAMALILLGFTACTLTVGGGGNTDTGVSGTIINGHWTANTYVSGDVTVTGSLIIDPGVTVTLASDVYISISSCCRVHRKGHRGTPHYFQERIVFHCVEANLY